MKKIFLVAMLLCTGGSLVAQQKGDVSVGANVAFQTSGSHIGVGAYLSLFPVLCGFSCKLELLLSRGA